MDTGERERMLTMGFHLLAFQGPFGPMLYCALCDRTWTQAGYGLVCVRLDDFMRDHAHGEARARPGDAS
jgi:hypothetical protein